jgi:hypothetical protein
MSKRTSSRKKKPGRPMVHPPTAVPSKWITKVWVLITAVATGFGLLAGFDSLRPGVSVKQGQQLDPKDPFSTQFTVTNENHWADVTDLHPSCRTIHVVTSHNVVLEALPPLQSLPIPVLKPLQPDTIACNRWIGGLGYGAGEVQAAYIEIAVTYEQDLWLTAQAQSFLLKGVMNSQHEVHWTPITQAELERDVPPFPFPRTQ